MKLKIEIELDLRQSFEVRYAIESRIKHIQEVLMNIFKNNPQLTQSYIEDVEILQNVLNQISKGHEI